MGDLTVAKVKQKKTGSSSIKCPVLSATNYTVWAIKMKILLKVLKVCDIIEAEGGDDEKKQHGHGVVGPINTRNPCSTSRRIGHSKEGLRGN